MTSKKWSLILAGLLSVGALDAHGQVVVNVGGSSASRNFIQQVAVQQFVPHATSPVTHYVSANNNRHAFTGTLASDGVTPGIIRYESTASSDGIRHLQYQNFAGDPAHAGTPVPGFPDLVPMDDPNHFQTFVNEAAPNCADTNGGAGYAVDVTSDGVTDFLEFRQCSGTIQAGLHVGASDAAGTSFGQSGPIGNTENGKIYNQSLLVNSKVAILPFKLVVGSGVKQSVGGVLTPITNLTRPQIDALFGPASLGAKDWRRLGYVPDVNGDGNDDGTATAPVVLCLRNTGSGTKAIFNQTILKGDVLEPGAASATVVFSSSSSGVITCVQNNKLGIGYLDADQLPNDLNDPNFGTTLGVNTVSIDGVYAYNPAYRLTAACQAVPTGFGYDFLGISNPAGAHPECDPRKDLINGKYTYWTLLNMNRRPNGSIPAQITSAQEALAAGIVASSSSPTVLEKINVGAYWVAPASSCVNKTVDKGPTIWKTAAAAPSYCPIP